MSFYRNFSSITKKSNHPSYKQGKYLCKEMFPYKSNGVWIIVVLTSILKDYLVSEQGTENLTILRGLLKGSMT